MIDDSRTIAIHARAAKRIDGLHPFQQEFTDVLTNEDVRIIVVEAPVGSGKSHIVRSVLDQPRQNAKNVVLTYPTKILMEAQLGSLREDFARDSRDLCVWPKPDNVFREDALNVINYSTDALLYLLKTQGDSSLKKKRGDLLHKLFDEQRWFGRERALVTTPDVLHLIAKHRYGAAKRLAQYLSPGGLFVFDEFHLYHNLANFVPLLETILEKWDGRIVLLSATPVIRKELRELFAIHSVRTIQFAPNSIGSPDGQDVRIFNHPLKVYIESFKTSDLVQWMKHLEHYLPTLSQPTAIILDSVHRVQRLKKQIETLAALLGVVVKEWSGIKKDRFELEPNSNTIVLGTAAIEVGIDMRFESLIFEATYWPSAIQRLGRVGRQCNGTAVIFSRRAFDPYLKDSLIWDRTDFEQQVLMQALNDPKETLIGGEMFRGDSYPFVLIEKDSRTPLFYDQSIFAMYTIDDFEPDWRVVEFAERREVLQDWRVSKQNIDEILLRDKVFPFWGALRGRLRPDYCRVEYCRETQDSLEVFADQSYVFAKPTQDEF
jgi:CRISPR-associated helicase Cas3